MLGQMFTLSLKDLEFSMPVANVRHFGIFFGLAFNVASFDNNGLFLAVLSKNNAKPISSLLNTT